MMLRLLSSVLTIQVSVAAALAAPAAEGALVLGETLVGVDALGRVAVAVDTVPGDGRADHLFLYTASERLAGPWFKRLDRAQVLFNDQGALTVIAADRSFILSVAVREPIRQPVPPGAEEFTDLGGYELAQLEPGGRAPLVDDLSYADQWSWPEPLWYDFLAPESGPCQSDTDCQAGGKDSPSCSISCPPGGSCSTSCGDDSYACCRCIFNDNGTPNDPNDDFVYQQCRCRPCVQGE